MTAKVKARFHCEWCDYATSHLSHFRRHCEHYDHDSPNALFAVYGNAIPNRPKVIKESTKAETVQLTDQDLQAANLLCHMKLCPSPNFKFFRSIDPV
jgi:hypothetical protein